MTSKHIHQRPYTHPSVRVPTYPTVLADGRIVEMEWESQENTMNQDQIAELVRQHLPDWAVKRAAGLELGAHLPTRDGRITGNAHIVRISPAPRGRLGLHYLILTDAGNSFVLTEPEIAAQYYPPEFIGDVNDIIKKFWREDTELLTV